MQARATSTALARHGCLPVSCQQHSTGSACSCGGGLASFGSISQLLTRLLGLLRSHGRLQLLLAVHCSLRGTQRTHTIHADLAAGPSASWATVLGVPMHCTQLIRQDGLQALLD